MSPILGARGGLAASAYGFTSGVAGPGDYQSISTVTVGSGGAANITFSSIPSTYEHLEIRYITRADVVDADSALLMRFNSDTTSNYSWHLLRGNGSAVLADGLANSSNPFVATQIGNTLTANVFGAGTINIFDYVNTNKYKTSRALGGFDANGSGYIQLTSQNWRSTSAISSIQLTFSTGSGFLQYSSFALYGVK
jgi:hypothetical protein